MINIKYLHNKEGFSLVELLIVVGLISILLSIAVPGIISQRPKWDINGTTRDLVSKLMMARIKAVQDNKMYAVIINWSVTPNTFKIHEVVNYNETTLNGSFIATPLAASEVRGGASLTACPITMYHPSGKATALVAAGLICPDFEHDGVQQYFMRIESPGSSFDPQYIYISPFTGSVTVSDVEPV